LGHLMRTLSLAAALRKNGMTPQFICSAESTPFVNLIEARGVTVEVLPSGTASGSNEDLAAVVRSAQTLGAWTCVGDGYAFEKSYCDGLSRQGFSVVAIDDQARLPFSVDLLINTNLGADKRPYQLADHTRTLFGPKYALLRPEFLEIEPDTHREYFLPTK